jgi:hypothetical protein
MDSFCLGSLYNTRHPALVLTPNLIYIFQRLFTKRISTPKCGQFITSEQFQKMLKLPAFLFYSDHLSFPKRIVIVQ